MEASFGRQFEFMMADICKDVFRKFNEGDGSIDFDSFVDSYFKSPIVKPKLKKVDPNKKKCESFTAKGTQCCKYAVNDNVFCSVHLKKKNTETVKKISSKKKSSKKIAKHTHGVFSPNGDCVLCKTHGDMFEEVEYEIKGDPDYVPSESDSDSDD